LGENREIYTPLVLRPSRRRILLLLLLLIDCSVCRVRKYMQMIAIYVIFTNF